MLSDQKEISLLAIIKTVTFRFKYQKFLPLALYQSKSNIYAIFQDYITNREYLQRFNNPVDAETAYNWCLHDQVIFNIATKQKHPGVDYSSLNAD